MTNTEKAELAHRYQQKTERDHVLDKPDTYIGSIEHIETTAWVLDPAANGRIVERTLREYVPGLFKLFDEAIVNCRDHSIRTRQQPSSETSAPVRHIDVSISAEGGGTITLYNDGTGIDVAKHPEYGVWIPELIFAHLRTSTNYAADEERIVGGKNGFGIKLVFIWSSWAAIELVDAVRGLKYTQEFRDNLDVIGEPRVVATKNKKPYTRISFRPDYARFGLGALSPEMAALFFRRAYDIAAVTDPTVAVRFNDAVIPVRNFAQYVDAYLGPKTETPRVHEIANERWEYVVALTPATANEFVQISFVNGIATTKGGKHVDYVVGQITRKLCELIEKKRKVKVSPAAIREQLWLFLRCDIVNPAFDSQTKDYMNTPSAKFGSKCEVSDAFVEKVAKMGVLDAACAISEAKEARAAKKTDGTKTRKVRGIPKLTDANLAGTAQSSSCTLILCEGDSAKAGIISGLTTADRDTIGVYPLKGKLLNVRKEARMKINENKEIAEIKSILGLETGRMYADRADVAARLRYGRVVFMTDQDLDGSHIKGLGLNLFASEWPSLLDIPEFIGFMNTPILKARRAATGEELRFYNEGEYDAWRRRQGHGTEGGVVAGWRIKYYKGLGTSTGAEFRDYFANHRKFVSFARTGAGSDDAVDLVFNKKRAEDRKQWLATYDRHAYLDTGASAVTYEEFVHRELIHFSKYDCDRSIPNLMDGLKISLRKILYAAFLRGAPMTSPSFEIKVAQFSGYVSEKSAYHHGEASLNAAIIGMAQNFVGSNNVNLFLPLGQFGTRLQGGKDASSERYIYTRLSPLTRALFSKADDAVLEYLTDDGQTVEPTWYAPILPMVLVNGSAGIGTGFSTNILAYHPLQLATYLEAKLTGRLEELSGTQFVPYYEGFRGQTVLLEGGRVMFRGTYERLPSTGTADRLRITELPVGTWTEPYKEYLNELVDAGQLRDVEERYTDTVVDFVVSFPRGTLDTMAAADLEKMLKLATVESTNNMHLFDAEDKLRHFARVEDIIDAYYGVRLGLYEKRRQHLIRMLENELRVMSNRARFISEILTDAVDLRYKTVAQVDALLSERGYDRCREGGGGMGGADRKEEGGEEDTAEETTTAGSYLYLTKMPMRSLTKELSAKILRERDVKAAELEEVRGTTPVFMWLADLAHFRTVYAEFRTPTPSSATTSTSSAAAAAPKKRGPRTTKPPRDANT